jgi:hypothetical protein
MTLSTGKYKKMRGFDQGRSADLFRRKQAEIALANKEIAEAAKGVDTTQSDRE